VGAESGSGTITKETTRAATTTTIGTTTKEEGGWLCRSKTTAKEE